MLNSLFRRIREHSRGRVWSSGSPSDATYLRERWWMLSPPPSPLPLHPLPPRSPLLHLLFFRYSLRLFLLLLLLILCSLHILRFLCLLFHLPFLFLIVLFFLALRPLIIIFKVSFFFLLVLFLLFTFSYPVASSSLCTFKCASFLKDCSLVCGS